MSNINDLNPAFSAITGDFNARLPQWWALDKEYNEGREISFVTSHITKEFFPCRNLVFTSSPSFISASGVELSLYEKCHHNLIFVKK